MTSDFNKFSIKEVSSYGVRYFMAARLDNLDNWVMIFSILGKGNPNDLMTNSGLIVQMISEPSKDNT